MLSKFKKTSEMTTILKVVLCSLFVFFISCSKFEEENNQTPVVPNINEAQASIGGENVFENYVNIEDFKNVQFEDNETYLRHKKAHDYFLSIETFPYARTRGQLLYLSKKLIETEEIIQKTKKGFSQNISLFHNFVFEPYISNDFVSFSREAHNYNMTRPFVELFFEKTKDGPLLLTPKEAYNISFQERQFLREKGENEKYIMRTIDMFLYTYHTGLNNSFVSDLRILSYPKNKDKFTNSVDMQVMYYQMPYKDNYLDYQNDTKQVKNIDDLKYFIKSGSLVFVFKEDLKELEKENFGNWGHMLIVGDGFIYDDPKEYRSLYNYAKLQTFQSFVDVKYMFSKILDEKVSFLEYLKHLYFIEAQNGVELYPNKNDKWGFERHDGLVRTSGNDESFQRRIKEATCIAVVNLNDGYHLSHYNLLSNVIKYANKQVDDKKNYNFTPTGADDNTDKHYCSGLAFYAFLNDKKYPSLRILTPNHLSTYYCCLIFGGKWYMPRTVCNSPFVYTRVWKKE